MMIKLGKKHNAISVSSASELSLSDNIPELSFYIMKIRNLSYLIDFNPFKDSFRWPFWVLYAKPQHIIFWTH